jgi:23S rRNA (guanine2445-N2)-methyltransferase / 23S rRNA (guanine2069-N7)-methyltransferase
MDVQDRLIQVREGGLRFWVNLTCYLDTGLFLDHRATRQMIRELAHGKRFLNLFAYTGSATVYAAAGGAAATTTVDLSLTYLDWARRNMDSNEFTGSQHSYIRADCVEWLRQEDSGTKQVFDLIFLDAPTFSNSKSMSATLDIQRDHAELIRSAVRLLTSEGILLFSANYRRFKLDAGLASELDVTDITDKTIPPDFVRNRRIHTCFRIARPAPAQTGRSPVLHSSGAGGRDGD